jgi:hypothetical protein
VPRKIDDPKNPKSYEGRDLIFSVRLHPEDRVQIEHCRERLDTNRTAIVRALVRAGLAATADDLPRLASYLVVAP